VDREVDVVNSKTAVFIVDVSARKRYLRILFDAESSHLTAISNTVSGPAVEAVAFSSRSNRC
jgi:hypothetical protein